MKIAALAVAAIVLTGCATSEGSEGWTATTNAKQIPWENNTAAWLISCSDMDQAGCYTRAKAVCPSGYARLNEGPSGRMLALTIRCT
jgi:hypothetical protein